MYVLWYMKYLLNPPTRGKQIHENVQYCSCWIACTVLICITIYFIIHIHVHTYTHTNTHTHTHSCTHTHIYIYRERDSINNCTVTWRESCQEKSIIHYREYNFILHHISATVKREGAFWLKKCGAYESEKLKTTGRFPCLWWVVWSPCVEEIRAVCYHEEYNEEDCCTHA